MLDFLSWFVLLVVVALYALGVFLAADRIRALRNVGLGLIGAGVFLLIARAVSTRIAVDAIVEDPRAEPVANVVAVVMTGLLRQIAWSGVVYGVVLLAFALAMGATVGCHGTAAQPGAVLQRRGGAVAGGTALAIAVLLWWSPGQSLRGLGHRSHVDRPGDHRGGGDASPDTASSSPTLASTMSSIGSDRRCRRAASVHPLPVDRRRSVSQLESLRALHDAGEISDSEYDRRQTAGPGRLHLTRPTRGSTAHASALGELPAAGGFPLLTQVGLHRVERAHLGCHPDHRQDEVEQPPPW